MEPKAERKSIYQDNRIVDYEGVSVSVLSTAQQQQLLELVDLFVSNMREVHARVRMDEVGRNMSTTLRHSQAAFSEPRLWWGDS